MKLFDRLILPRRRLKAAQELAGEAFLRAQRLEIALEALTMRVAASEARIVALDHSVRGRLGGRPPKQQQPSTPATPVPLGALHMFPSQE